MAMDPLPTWKQEIKNIKPDKSNLTDKLADVIDQRVTGKLATSLIQGPPVQFTWQKSIFASLIKPLPAAPALPPGLQQYCDAWEAATLASTIVVAPGNFFGVSAPPTLFSVVIASILMPPSIAAGKAAMFAALSSAAPIQIADLSPLAQALYTAFSTLQVQATGLNSVPPPPGPQPLVAVSPVL